MLPPNLLKIFLEKRSVCTDTRKISPGDIFFALKGVNFNGNALASQALKAGASYVIVDEAQYVPASDDRWILVPDALLALQNLAREFSKSLSIPMLGVTGSNGKTTTKELLHAVLSTKKKTWSTHGNLNNHIGVPLTLLSIPVGTEIAVIEMGANKPRDIKELAEIALPTHGLITNIGHAHMELFENLDGVERTKGQLFDFLRETEGTVFVNELDERVIHRSELITNKITFGRPTSDFFISAIEQEKKETRVAIASVYWNEPHIFSSHLIGKHNAENILAAVAVGWTFGIPVEEMIAAIAAYVPKMNRSQFLHSGKLTILLDAYNANPSSMEAVIRNVFSMNYGRSALVLGDMFELGDQSEALHRRLGEIISEYDPAIVIGVGTMMKWTLEECKDLDTQWYADANEAGKGIAKDLEGMDFVLVKGSRGMSLENILPSLGVKEESMH